MFLWKNVLFCLSAVIVDEELLVTAAGPQRVGGLVAHIMVGLGMAASQQYREKYKTVHPALWPLHSKWLILVTEHQRQRDFLDKNFVNLLLWSGHKLTRADRDKLVTVVLPTFIWHYERITVDNGHLDTDSIPTSSEVWFHLVFSSLNTNHRIYFLLLEYNDLLNSSHKIF